ncbi:bifunctional tRNA (5-methylaminomethyl-2-thiouridine)(34)-methyltransferase MnmD/FAD-dependent 5-carboxymethylaminomethyl-2-thiouridine(34) oxidoreductase MnmC [Leptospira perolatii]|uniref:tRNA 5-methylaminomethyl-2-thiouridine biosynthesis bifunctional protein MnmC n=1 Tax=Leptospira perolatii TaxID=2023191 RepID=A0A2M9ZIR2_9LEPT|nr:bifunctional tRNA (5-methylaminomethyl-2-thiouridine)(34)-methyltransferase MnmD/FAD-dependent 5-carboxymethylaminomethyl-2-thiouridine(34) oxidoreductase MnmC [Leptospira perolatii]PJZ68170.1 bifunctional tRNA (5-methylaminomethyl-2-thiouridine)(34)-methyltransferase MnmD/FAD-dependent 5-carboxymethylaminomethyl-2-thiouridine(34) oxidoreductase MnmC [Leptospira perolatii]PJZ71948.1 bifunctional tRNA (5-methylaminomethyl-2-thiouridine)(34)-methyltransferase MnmD/FAD-dependent 5-carboxymethylam
MIDWKENGTPVSKNFGDIYFSPENGLEETRHVFIDGNNLSDRLSLSNDSNIPAFSILEIGFGTGLNFFATWKLWEELRIKSPFSLLKFVSYEMFPLTRDEIEKAISCFPELSGVLEKFLPTYTNLVAGCNSFLFEVDRICLHLWIGDARSLLPDSSGKFDCFFLDGFAPSKNPELWEEELLFQIGKLANKGATFSTFTVAKSVKDSLSKAGFQLEKKKGYGRKREMLCGKMLGEQAFGTSSAIGTNSKKSAVLKNQFAYPITKQAPPKKETPILIIGGGLAGASVARSLAIRGYSIIVIDANSPNQASAIPKAISHPHLTKFPSPTSLWTLRALGHSLRRYPYLLQKEDFAISGTLQLETEECSWERLTQGASNHSLPIEIAEELSDSSQKSTLLSAKQRAMFFPSGFWTETPRLVENLFNHRNIQKSSCTVKEIRKEDSNWMVLDQNGVEIACGSALVLANSIGIQKLLDSFLGESLFELSKVRGQLLEIEFSKGAGPIESNIGTEPIHVAEHYLTPLCEGKRILGSTFDEFHLEENPRSEDTQALLSFARNRFEGLNLESVQEIREVVGIRSQTKDRFPILGPVPNPKQFKKIYTGSGLPRNRNKEYEPMEPIQGLFVFGGLGSRGVLSSLIGGELLASVICNEPLPVENSLYSALDPARFLYRKIRNMEPVTHQESEK